ncbi:MAG TPA: hypothetical protein VEW68_07010 [Patescibacteria group bacterium]|nr:hypothetical protein [Patescibacteria group bacterium]
MAARKALPEGRLRTLIWTALLGLAGGAGVSLLAFYLARYGPSGGNWSFRGNGALAAYTLVPVLLTLGWTGLVWRARTSPFWLSLAVGAGLVGAAIAAADAALLPLFGRGADATLGGVLLVALAAWAVAAPVLSALMRFRSSGRSMVGIHVAAGILWPVALGSGLLLAGLAFPAGS